jgi:hypothetical protein
MDVLEESGRPSFNRNPLDVIELDGGDLLREPLDTRSRRRC